MTGIHLPPGLASIQTPDAQALRAGITTLDKVAILQPVLDASESGVQNSTDQAIRNSQAARAANGPAGPGMLPPGTSTRESLSFAARAILTLMDGTPAQPLRSAGPLLPGPPVAGSGATVAALAALVDESGLFYESHLSQWVAGTRPLASILEQPQAPLGRPAMPNAPPQPPGARAGPDTPMLTYNGPPGTGSATPSDLPRAAGPVTIPASQLLAEALAAPGNPRVAHNHAPAEQGVRQGTGSHAAYSKNASPVYGMPSRPSAASVATQAYQATADAARVPDHASMPRHSPLMDLGTEPAQQPAAQGPAIHPSTEGLVRQQLELLATQQFRFSGEAWPGTPMEWDITRQEDSTGGQEAAGAARQWSSRLQLQLPRLGLVEAVLTFGPNGLEARLATSETDVAARFIEARPQLRNQLQAQGIVLQRLNVETRDSMDDGGAA